MKTLKNQNPVNNQIDNHEKTSNSTNVDESNNDDIITTVQEEEDDRLSSLPDSLIVTILSLLPIDTAAATSALSHRFSNLWTQLTHIHLYPHWFSSTPPEHALTTACHIFRQLTSPKIHTFLLSLDYKNLTEPPPTTVNDDCSWISELCGRKIEQLELIIHDPWPFITVPNCVFCTESLVKLKLSGSIDCRNVSEIESIRLPNLKKLRLYELYLEIKFLNKLLKSCPKLEHLSLALDLSHELGAVRVIAPKLKTEHIHMFATSQVCGFLFDSPLVECVHFSGYFAIYRFINKAVKLREVDFGFWENCLSDQTDLKQLITKLMVDISSVGYIVLNGNFAWFNPFDYVDAEEFKEFRNLNKLLLRSFMPEEVNCDFRIPLHWLRRMKRIEMRRNEVSDNDIKLVEYVLCNADVLEELYIEIPYIESEILVNPVDELARQKDRAWNERVFCKAVFAVQRKSSVCVIEFDGNYIYCKGNDVENGLLACQIK